MAVGHRNPRHLHDIGNTVTCSSPVLNILLTKSGCTSYEHLLRVFLLNWGQFVFRVAVGVFVCYFFLGCCQGCGLGLDVSVSRRTDVSSRSRLEKNCQRLGLVSVSAIYVSCPRPIFGKIMQATVCSVNGL